MENCGTCKWFNQAEDSGGCFNPMQKNEDLIQYCYWDDKCRLIEEGEKLTELELNQLGFERLKNEISSIDGKDLSYYFYKLKQ